MLVATIQQWIFFALSLGLFAIEVWALINALRFSPQAYIAAGKRTKTFWSLLTGLAVLLGFLTLPVGGGGFGGMLFMLIGIVIAGIFLADVLPALRQVMGRAYRNRY
ncbi:MAG: DUF2516 family protein [Brachybacterium sp.]|nr:DUF2516 family protein [Brachybacterium sp.]